MVAPTAPIFSTTSAPPSGELAAPTYRLVMRSCQPSGWLYSLRGFLGGIPQRLALCSGEEYCNVSISSTPATPEDWGRALCLDAVNDIRPVPCLSLTEPRFLSSPFLPFRLHGCIFPQPAGLESIYLLSKERKSWRRSGRFSSFFPHGRFTSFTDMGGQWFCYRFHSQPPVSPQKQR